MAEALDRVVPAGPSNAMHPTLHPQHVPSVWRLGLPHHTRLWPPTAVEIDPLTVGLLVPAPSSGTGYEGLRCDSTKRKRRR